MSVCGSFHWSDVPSLLCSNFDSKFSVDYFIFTSLLCTELTSISSSFLCPKFRALCSSQLRPYKYSFISPNRFAIALSYHLSFYCSISYFLFVSNVLSYFIYFYYSSYPVVASNEFCVDTYHYFFEVSDDDPNKCTHLGSIKWTFGFAYFTAFLCSYISTK